MEVTEMRGFLSVAREPDTGEWVPFAFNLNEAAAHLIAQETIDTISCGSSVIALTSDADKVAYVLDSIRVVPALVTIHESYLND